MHNFPFRPRRLFRCVMSGSAAGDDAETLGRDPLSDQIHEI